jgi:hypothetical protein
MNTQVQIFIIKEEMILAFLQRFSLASAVRTFACITFVGDAAAQIQRKHRTKAAL